MRNTFLIIGAILLLGGGGLWRLQAAPPAQPLVAVPTATPNLITVNTPTNVVFTVSIPNQTLNPASVNLLRVAADGSSNIVTQMVDNGQNGDQQPGDKIFTARLSLDEPQAGEVKFQVSAAFRGILRRSLSPVFSLEVWNVLSNPAAHFSVNYPAGWTPKAYQDIYTISSTTTLPVLPGDPGNEIQINILPANNFSTILAWLQDYYSGEVTLTSQSMTYYINPAGVQFALVPHIPGMSSDNINAYTLQGNTVIQLAVSPASTFNSVFANILSSFRPN